MLTVKDIMTKDVYAVEFEASADEAAWGLTRRNIGGAPVRDREGQLVGMLTKDDLVDPAPRQWTKGKESTVGDLMDPEVLAVYQDDAALVAVHEMSTRHLHRLIVLDGDNNLVGIVTSMDVVHALERGDSFGIGDTP